MYLFQYCPKIVVFSEDNLSILLCKRKGEADYDGVYSFIGGKMETTDSSLLNGLRREKDEEVGAEFKVNLLLTYSTNVVFTKKDGSAMILPHYYAQHVSGPIVLSEEYSDYKWVATNHLEAFEPKIQNVLDMTLKVARLRALANAEDFFII